MTTSLYIHIPFCRRKCLYCDFYSVVNKNGDSSVFLYIDTLIRQIEPLRERFSTIYIGGGTPTALPKAELERLLKSLCKNIDKDTECTVEANPESLDSDKVKLLLDCGVDRLSIGVQSFDERKLKRLGRVHNAARAREAVGLAAKRGFKNISADLIFGVWEERPDDWLKELEEAAALPVTHISCYALTYERSTPLFAALKNKSVVPLEDEAVAAMYEAAIDRLAVRGFKQYEVSNFARPGFACRHNLQYWNNAPYIGLGASAVSYVNGVRSRNVASVTDFIRRSGEGRPLIASSEKLSPVRRAKETAALKIRTKDGIDFAWFKERTGYDFMELEQKAIAELLEKDLIKYTKQDNNPAGIALKRKGFLFCDTVSSALL